MTPLLSSWDNPMRPCTSCGAACGATCEDQCPAAIATERADEHDLRVEAAHDRAGVAA